MEKLSNIAAIVITYNRIEKLKKSLLHYEKQTVLPKYVIVVNNASTDGTKDFLDKWRKKESSIKKIIINSSTNLGGSGGFYLGQKEFLKLDADWVVLSDDDAYLNLDYIERASSIINRFNNDEISVICGKVIPDNTKGLSHRQIIVNKWSYYFAKPVSLEQYKKKIFEIDTFSYVGPIINKKKLILAGLVNKDFFIRQDDMEHALRLRNVGRILCCSELEVVHDEDIINESLSWKDYYNRRNKMFIIKKQFSLQYPYILIKEILKALLCILKGKSLIEMKLRLRAIKDAVFNNLGKNKIYKPGWKP